MARTIRYHLDEHVSHAVAEGLRRRGIDVTTTPETGLLGVDDIAQIGFANSQGRVIVTNDDDYLKLHDQGTAHCGICYSHQQSRTIGQIIGRLELIWEVLEPEEMKNQIEYL